MTILSFKLQKYNYIILFACFWLAVITNVMNKSYITVSYNITLECYDGNSRFTLSLVVKEYLENGLEIPENWSETSKLGAFIVSLDDNTKGVLAVRLESTIDEYSIFPFGRIFYIYDNYIRYKKVNMTGFSSIVRITYESNTPFIMGGDGGSLFYTFFEMKNGVLVKDFTIYTMLFEIFYLIPGSFYSGWEYRTPITEKEFYRITNERDVNKVRYSFEDDFEKLISLILRDKYK